MVRPAADVELGDRRVEPNLPRARRRRVQRAGEVDRVPDAGAARREGAYISKYYIRFVILKNENLSQLVQSRTEISTGCLFEYSVSMLSQ